MANRTLLCHAHGYDGAWQALCFDFDIAVEGQSFEQVRTLLEEAVSSYVQDASKEDRRTAERLLARRAPLFVRCRLLASYAAHILFRGRRPDECQAGFDLPCHA